MADAKTLSGSKRLPNSQMVTIVGVIKKVIETERSFKIVIKKHSALYTYPKTDKTAASEAHEFFNSHKKGKIPVRLVVDAYNRDIITAGPEREN